MLVCLSAVGQAAKRNIAELGSEDTAHKRPTAIVMVVDSELLLRRMLHTSAVVSSFN